MSRSPPTLITPRRFADPRGWFAETYQAKRFAGAGLDATFVQDNDAWSRGALTLRGMHYQSPPHAQGKLVRCVIGKVLDVIVDIRKGSPTFGRHHAVELSAESGAQLYVPMGYAHCYLTLSEEVLVSYKVTDFYAKETEGGVRFDDPALAIGWPADPATFIVNDRDRTFQDLSPDTTPFTYDGVPFDLKTVSF